jgi:WD40 repeat protein
LPGGRLVRTITHDAAVSAVAFATTGRDLVSGGIDGSLRVTRDDGPSIDLTIATGGIDAAAFLPDGQVVATDTSRRLRIHDASRAGLLADLPMPMRAALLRISLNGHRLLTLASYMQGAAPALWDLERYQLVGRLEGHVGQVRSARLVHEDREILTAGGDGTARLWDATTGRLVRTYHGGSRFFVDATLSPDGTMVVAGDGDGLLRFWEAATGQALWLLRAHKSHVVGVHFEGADIVTRGFGGDLARWQLPPPENVVGACDSPPHGNRATTTGCDMVLP